MLSKLSSSLILSLLLISPASSAQREIDVEALQAEAQRLGIECNTERRAQILICEQKIKRAKIQQRNRELEEDLARKVRALKDEMNRK